MQVTGRVLVGPEFRAQPARLVVEDGRIQAVEDLDAATAGRDIVLPAFVNAHTHIGDSIAKEAGRRLSLDELVAPPDGLKHRILRDATDAEKVAAIRHSVRYMQNGGTGAFIDFREGGIAGVAALRAATRDAPIREFAFGRGDAGVLDVADGYGASGARDADFGAERRAARSREKPFAIHAGERDPSDINDAMDLQPDHLVHMVHARDIHLDRLADTGIPVVVCPRSNLVTGVGQPPIDALLERTAVALGTDNVMLNGPSMFREMELTAKLFDVDARTVLQMATQHGADLVGLDWGVLERDRRAAFLVLDGQSDNLIGYQDALRAVVRRAGVADVKTIHLPAASSSD